MQNPKSQQLKLLFSFNKLLIFPLCITYMIINVITVLNYDPNLNIYYELWEFCGNHGIDEYFYFFENLGMELSLSCNNVISAILTLMMITDIIFSIRNGRKQIITWILYGIITVIILFIGFVASPEFYDSV